MRMVFKGYGFVLFLVLAIVLLPGAFSADYETFLRQHYDNSVSSGGDSYCEKTMKKRGMTKPVCKETNSFIHSTTNKINSVCDDTGGEPYLNGLRRSLNKFSVTTCKHKGGSTRPPCKYRGNNSQRFIVIRCVNGYPVHFDEGHI